jgi:hypothetical protein
MTARACLRCGAPEIRGSCRRCGPQPRLRGTTSERGYGYDWQQKREEVGLAVAAGLAICWRCREPIKAGQPWDLGHDDLDRSIIRGPEHARAADCPMGGNRATSRRDRRQA